jgi:hypothetical protein
MSTATTQEHASKAGKVFDAKVILRRARELPDPDGSPVAEAVKALEWELYVHTALITAMERFRLDAWCLTELGKSVQEVDGAARRLVEAVREQYGEDTAATISGRNGGEQK